MKNASFRAIWVSLLASSVGDWSARLALAILVLERTGSPSLSSLVIAVSFIPWIGPGQLLAARLGHLSRRKVMIGADLLRAALFALLLVHLPVAVILVVVFVAATATPPFEAARSALTVEGVPEEDYGAAIVLLDMTDQSAIVVGYLLGGILVVAGGYQLAMIANVGSFLLSAAALTRFHSVRNVTPRETVAAQLKRGVRRMWADGVIRKGTLTLIVAGLPVAAVEATAAAYARIVLHASASTAGELAAGVPVGILLAIPLLPRSGDARRLLRAGATIAMIGGFVGAAAFGAGRMPGAIVGYIAAGVLSASGTPAQVAFQPRIRAEDRAGVFSVVQGLLMTGQAFGAALGGLLASAFGPRQAAVGWMIVVVVLAGALWVMAGSEVGTAPGAEPGMRSEDPSRPDEGSP